MATSQETSLSKAAYLLRWTFLSASPLLFFLLHENTPSNLVGWLPACPLYQLSGIPCVTTGLTRSFHAAVQGDWHHAWYFNPLGPILITAMAIAWATCLLELCKGKKTLLSLLLFRNNRRSTTWLLLLLTVSWIAHVLLASALPKPELINSDKKAAQLLIQLCGNVAKKRSGF